MLLAIALVSGWVLVAVAFRSPISQPGTELWQAVSRSKTQRPPWPEMPEWNPFGLFGGPTGRSTSAVLNLTADELLHPVHLDCVTPWGSFVAELSHAALDAPPQTGAALPDCHPHGDTYSHGHGHSHGHADPTRDPSLRYLDTVTLCYLFDPTNSLAIMALTSEVYPWPGRIRRTIVTLPGGETIPKDLALARQICTYSIEQLDVHRPYWPEHALFAARSLISLWLIDCRIGDLRRGPVEDTFRSTEYLKVLKSGIDSRLAAFRERRELMQRKKYWQRRSLEEREVISALEDEIASYSTTLGDAIVSREL